MRESGAGAPVEGGIGAPPAEAAAGERAGAPDVDWHERLRAGGAEGDEATRRLHDLLLRAARVEVARRRRGLAHLRGGDADDIAQQAAADALMGVLRRLDDFRGESRFTTWAYKFALYEAAVAVRRRAWQVREMPLAPEAWPQFAAAGPGPQERAEQAEQITEVRRAIDDALTPHQRQVLVALAVNGVPIDVLAERLGTTRGALYKTLHDARARLRGRLGMDTGKDGGG